MNLTKQELTKFSEDFISTAKDAQKIRKEKHLMDDAFVPNNYMVGNMTAVRASIRFKKGGAAFRRRDIEEKVSPARTPSTCGCVCAYICTARRGQGGLKAFCMGALSSQG